MPEVFPVFPYEKEECDRNGSIAYDSHKNPEKHIESGYRNDLVNGKCHIIYEAAESCNDDYRYLGSSYPKGTEVVPEGLTSWARIFNG